MDLTIGMDQTWCHFINSSVRKCVSNTFDNVQLWLYQGTYSLTTASELVGSFQISLFCSICFPTQSVKCSWRKYICSYKTLQYRHKTCPLFPMHSPRWPNKRWPLGVQPSTTTGEEGGCDNGINPDTSIRPRLSHLTKSCIPLYPGLLPPVTSQLNTLWLCSVAQSKSLFLHINTKLRSEVYTQFTFLLWILSLFHTFSPPPLQEDNIQLKKKKKLF